MKHAVIRKRRAGRKPPEKSLLQNASKLTLSKAIYLITFVVILLTNKGLAQNVTNVSVNTIWPFNTGFTLAAASTPSTLPVGNQDPNWQVSTTMSSGPQAIIINPPNQTACSANWSNNQIAGPYSMWITSPSATCSGVPSNVSCTSITDLYFSKTFSFPANPIVKVSGIIYASDFVEDIWLVNSAGTFTVWNRGSGSSLPNHRFTAINFSWCNFTGGSNKIYIHVKQNPGWSSSTCKVMGVRVETWATFGTSSITGPTLACAGSNYTYGFPSPASFGINPVTTPNSYSWAPPQSTSPTWMAPGTTSVLSAVAGTNSGIMTASFYTVGPNGNKYCIATGGYSITVPPPLTLTVPNSTLCTGKSLTITATPGASSYSFYAPFPASIYTGPTNSVVVTPTAGNKVYTVKSSNGCVYTKTISVNVFQTPNVTVTTNTPAICRGNCASLTIGGTAWQYSLWPCGFQPVPCQVFTWNPLPVCPTITTTYTVPVKSVQGCTNFATVLLTVNNIPTLTAIASPSVVCAGQNANVVLTASGATTYTWANVPNPTNVNPKTVTVNTPTVFTVTGANGLCTASKTVAVSTISPPVIIVNPPQICTGIANTITATGGNNYTWNFSAGTSFTTSGNSATIISTSAVLYTVCGTGANSCSSCTTGIISLGAPIPITVPNVTLCTSAGPCTTISATSSYTVPVTYTWTASTSPSTGSVVSVCPTVQTIYTVSASSSFSGCPNTATMAVAMASNCCAQPTTGLTQLSTALGGNYLNTTYFLNSSITLTNTSLFQNSDIWITEGVSITVPAGKQLQLDNAHLFACANKMWQGIVVQDGGSIQTLNTFTAMSMIEDAIVAIDLDAISATNASPNLPLNLSRLIFNRNYIGIKISNSAANMTVLPLGITGCLFTSRLLPYTTYPSTVSVPNNDFIGTTAALRFPTTPTTGLMPPYGYMATNYAPAFLKFPYTTQPGHIGIKIENIGDPAATGYSTFISTGVDIGVTNTGPFVNDFNMFEGIGIGIDVTDACLTTKNNVFQNMQQYIVSNASFGGVGINHTRAMGSTRFTRLDLREENNYFWDCHVGVNAVNVYETWITGAIFRSTHMISSAFAPLTTSQGDIGVYHESEQSNFTVEECQFNNVKRGIISKPAPNYNLDHGIVFRYNYFGPEVQSNIPYSSANSNSSEYMDIAIDIDAPAGTYPANVGSWLINSNKINRVFRGINFNGFADPPVLMSYNEVLIEEDLTYNQDQYGIAVQNNLGNMSVSSNTVDAVVHWQPTINGTNTAIYCQNNNSPLVSCNAVMNTGYGFQFEGYNARAVWMGNTMCRNMFGLGLTNNGVIGQQGTQPVANNNLWLEPGTSNNSCDPWGTFFADRQTYTYFSNPQVSPIYIWNSPSSVPVWNLSVPAGNQYQFGAPASLYYSSWRILDCSYSPVNAPPSWRTANPDAMTTVDEKLFENTFQIYPNPTNGALVVKGDNLVSVILYDISGKKLFEKENLQNAEEFFNVSDLSPGVYLIEVKNSNNKIVRKKLIKTE